MGCMWRMHLSVRVTTTLTFHSEVFSRCHCGFTFKGIKLQQVSYIFELYRLSCFANIIKWCVRCNARSSSILLNGRSRICPTATTLSSFYLDSSSDLTTALLISTLPILWPLFICWQINLPKTQWLGMFVKTWVSELERNLASQTPSNNFQRS